MQCLNLVNRCLFIPFRHCTTLQQMHYILRSYSIWHSWKIWQFLYTLTSSNIYQFSNISNIQFLAHSVLRWMFSTTVAPPSAITGSSRDAVTPGLQFWRPTIDESENFCVSWSLICRCPYFGTTTGSTLDLMMNLVPPQWQYMSQTWPALNRGHRPSRYTRKCRIGLWPMLNAGPVCDAQHHHCRIWWTFTFKFTEYWQYNNIWWRITSNGLWTMLN